MSKAVSEDTPSTRGHALLNEIEDTLSRLRWGIAILYALSERADANITADIVAGLAETLNGHLDYAEEKLDEAVRIGSGS